MTTDKLTIEKVKKYNHQLMHIVTLLIAQAMISIFGIVIAIFHFKHNIYLYVGILMLNIMALFLFKPFKIMYALHEGYGYKGAFQAVAELSKKQIS